MPCLQKSGRGGVGAGCSLDRSRYYALYYEMYKHRYKERYIKQRDKPPDNIDYKQQLINCGFLIVKS